MTSCLWAYLIKNHVFPLGGPIIEDPVTTKKHNKHKIIVLGECKLLVVGRI
eukprot:m.357851 g.357851  ORF g.357851 m.357851 type:complete len:51 (+) comp98917_c0_seq1:84-236(+)